MKSRAILFQVAALVFSLNASAADTCNSLLLHGITDRVREDSLDTKSSVIRKEICDAYSSFKSDAAGGNAKANYGAFSGGASFTRQQIESVGKLYCESNLSDAASQSVISTASDKISTAALDA